jgi:hypothetical protein
MLHGKNYATKLQLNLMKKIGVHKHSKDINTTILFCHPLFLYPVGMKHTNMEHNSLLSHLSENAQI